MYNVNSASAQWDIITGKKSSSSFDITGGSGVFGATLKEMLANKNGIQGMLDKLADLFPDADISKGKPEAGVEGADKYYGKEGGDKVAVDENLLASMFGNGDLAKKVEEAIASFFNSNAGANPVEGTYAQRSVSITITTIRFNVAQRAEGSGELLTGQELQTAFQEKIQDLINRIFGTGSGDASSDKKGDDETKDTAPAAATESGKDKTAQSLAGYSAMMFSMELFFSSGFINNMGASAQASGQSMQFSMSFSSYAANFQDFSGNFLPQSIYQSLADSTDSSGPFTSLLDGALGKFGMSSNGFSATQAGFSFKMGQSRDLLSELMDQLFANRNRPVEKPEEKYENDETPEAEEVAEVAGE
jgi:hypothetical protein